jgi:hypothetical protein
LTHRKPQEFLGKAEPAFIALRRGKVGSVNSVFSGIDLINRPIKPLNEI